LLSDATKGGEKYENRNIIFSSPASRRDIGSAQQRDSSGRCSLEDQLAGTGYCHEKFPAIARHTLGNDQPELSSKGDEIDFYGPWARTPLGRINQTQRLEEQHRWQTEYESE
jgi:hypothetical protein